MVSRRGKLSSSEVDGGFVLDRVEGRRAASHGLFPEAGVQELLAGVSLVVARPVEPAVRLEAGVRHAAVHRAQAAELGPDGLGAGLAEIVPEPARRDRREWRCRRAPRPAASRLAGTRCTRRSLLVTVPSASQKLADAGRTTSAISAVFVRKMSCTTSVSSSASAPACASIGLALRRVLAEDEERRELSALHGLEHVAEVPAVLPRDRTPRRARTWRGRRVLDVLEAGELVGNAPMSPPPCTLFCPRSGLRPEP